MSAEILFTTISLTIILGFLGHLIFQKYRISDVLLLMLLGIILGPVTGLVKIDTLQPFGGFISALALVIILSDGGMELKLRELLGGLARATILAASGFAVTLILVGLTSHFILRMDWIQALFLGSVIGGTSSLVVIPVVQALKCPDRIRIILSLESALTDVLVVIIALAFAAMLITHEVSIQSALTGIFAKFSIAIVIGFILGLGWLKMIKVIEKQPYSFMLTLAFLLALYAGVEYVGGSGPMTVLAVGVVLGNWSAFGDITIVAKSEFWHKMTDMQSEVSFLVKSFFFVYMGLQIKPAVFRWDILLGSGLLLLAILAARYAAIYITSLKDEELKSDKRLLLLMLPRGLSAAVMAAVPFTVYGFNGAENVVWYTFMIIILTNIVATFGPRFIKK